jgi:O-antigen/teichoic acid export membrane protein
MHTPQAILKRLGLGTLASAYGYFVTATLQLVSLPVLVHAWGADVYGKWLMITTLPTYLTLFDLGFSTTATIVMGRKVGRGDYDGARAVFRSVLVLSTSISVGLAVIAMISTFFLPEWIAQRGFLDSQSAHAIPLLVLYSAAILQTAIISAGLRSTGNYAVGTFFSDNITLTEGLLAVVAAMVGGGFIGAATVLLAGRLIGLGLLSLFLRSQVPWLGLSYKGASLEEIRKLFGPSISISLLPVGLGVSLQGIVVVIGIVLSPAMAAVFASTRTICRFAVQIAATVNRASVPELSHAIGGGRKEIIALILLANVVTAALFILPANIILAIFGRQIVYVWSLGKIDPPNALIIIISAGILFHACWWNTATLLTAIG